MAETYVGQDTTGQFTAVTTGESPEQADINKRLGDIVGPRYREYRERWNEATRMDLVPEFPIHLDLEVSYGCNLACPQCVFGMPKEERPYEPKVRQLPYEKMKEVILEGVSRGLRSLGFSYYNEPLLKKGLFDFIRWCRDVAGIVDLHVTTNGTLLDEKTAEMVFESGVTRLRFSLDGFSPEIYEKIRVGAKYEVTHRNIFRFLEMKKQRGAKLPIISVNFVHMKTNEHEKQAFIEFWKDKVDYIAIQDLIVLPGGETYLKNVQKADSHNINLDFRCPQPFHRAIIRSDGLVLPCCWGFGEMLPMGNVHEKPLSEIWKNEKYQALRQLHREGRWAEHPVCKLCVESSVGK